MVLISTELQRRKQQASSRSSEVFWMNELGILRKTVDQCLLNNMNTRGVIMQFQSTLNQISKALIQSSEALPLPLLQSIVDYCSQWLLDVGFTNWMESAVSTNQHGILDTFCLFRKAVRDNCLTSLKQGEGVNVCKSVLKECDIIRETMSAEHKITLIDGKEDLLWVTGELPKKEKAPSKQKPKQGLVASLPPSEMFKQSGEYSCFDERGFPSCDASGKPLSANKIKKLTKQYNTHKAIHEKWLASQSKSIVC